MLVLLGTLQHMSITVNKIKTNTLSRGREEATGEVGEVVGEGAGLCVFSKIFESVLNHQLQKYFHTILSILFSAFRKMYSCQAVLLKMVEDWKKALDNYQHTGIIVIDLCKAFNSIPHSYLIKKTR